MFGRWPLLVAVLAVAAVVIVAVVMITRDAPEESTPTKDDPGAYTQTFVQEAIHRYERDGKQATIDYYNRVESVDGEWYVFFVGRDGVTISHHNPKFRGRDPSLRVDPTGYFYGDELLAADEDGRWVDYVILTLRRGRTGKSTRGLFATTGCCSPPVGTSSNGCRTGGRRRLGAPQGPALRALTILPPTTYPEMAQPRLTPPLGDVPQLAIPAVDADALQRIQVCGNEAPFHQRNLVIVLQVNVV